MREVSSLRPQTRVNPGLFGNRMSEPIRRISNMHSILSEIDLEARTLADEYEEASAVVARAQAAQARVLVRTADLGKRRVAALTSPSSREAELPYRALAAELGAAAKVSDRTVQNRMNEAAVLNESFPATFEAWGEGRISTGHVAVIMEHGLTLPEPARSEFESEAVVRAESTTPGRLGSSLARLAESLQPRTIAERHQQARASRGAYVRDIGDGMAEFSTVQPAVLAHGMHDRITQQAKAIKTADPTDARTLDQIRRVRWPRCDSGNREHHRARSRVGRSHG